MSKDEGFTEEALQSAEAWINDLAPHDVLIGEVRRLQARIAELETEESCVDCGSRQWICRICRQSRDWCGVRVVEEER